MIRTTAPIAGRNRCVVSGSESRMHLRSFQNGPVLAATGRLDAVSAGLPVHVVAAAIQIRGAHTISNDLSRIVFSRQALRDEVSVTVIAASGRAQHVLSVCEAVALLPHQMANAYCLRGTRHVLIAARRPRFCHRISCGRKRR